MRVVSIHKVFSNHFCWATFNMMTFDHVHQLTVFKERHARGRWRKRRGRAARRLAKRAARAARKRQQGQLLRVATWNVRTLAVNGANGYGRACSVLHEAARQDVSVVGMQETRRAGRTEFAAAGFRVFCCGTETGGVHGVGIAVKESLCKTSTFTTEFIDERLMAMRFLLAGHRGAVNFVAAYAFLCQTALSLLAS